MRAMLGGPGGQVPLAETLVLDDRQPLRVKQGPTGKDLSSGKDLTTFTAKSQAQNPAEYRGTY